MTAHRTTLTLYAVVALGSAIGALLRYLVSVYMLTAFGADFPWGTLAANALGSFAIGMLAVHLSGNPTRLFHFTVTGFCGGFTTFSIFSLETITLFEAGRILAAMANVGLSVSVWMIAVWLGYRMAIHIKRTPT